MKNKNFKKYLLTFIFIYNNYVCKLLFLEDFIREEIENINI